MEIYCNKKKIVTSLSIFALLLITIHIVILCIYYYVGDPEKFDFVQMFDLDMEANIPTVFSSLILALSALCFYLLGLYAENTNHADKPYWFGLGAIFLFLSFDEGATIHEAIGDYTEKFVHASGYLFYPWVISYGGLVTFLGIMYFRFFWKMEKKVFWSFMLSAFIYLLGAVVFELFGANEASAHGTDTVLYSTLYTIEESLEMFGVIYLIWILLSLLEKKKLHF